MGKKETWEGTNVPRKAYATYVMGKDAILNFKTPVELFTTEEKNKMKKITVKQQLKNANVIIVEREKLIDYLRIQLANQNRLIDRARIEGNNLIEMYFVRSLKYNKLAGKHNAIRSLVTNND